MNSLEEAVRTAAAKLTVAEKELGMARKVYREKRSAWKAARAEALKTLAAWETERPP